MTNLTTMTAYLLGAMQSWLPVSTDGDVARYTQYAHDMAVVTVDLDEKPLFRDDDNRSKTGLLLAAVARFEGSYAENVDTGHCRPNQCDHGAAFTLFQIHPEVGMKFDGEFWGYSTAPDRITGPMLVANRVTAARMALHMMRRSLRAGSLCIYTGESCEAGKHPKADLRIRYAKNYQTAHPMPVLEESASLQ